ncbi:hypothetical protein PUN28_015969 [Cardiocondyla obscurior]|uniref:Uncharacterized protein n=1 Tax=Cardiocondyla obscurior TaxID=286306 RepID=A0AAW2EVL3_9HYME
MKRPVGVHSCCLPRHQIEREEERRGERAAPSKRIPEMLQARGISIPAAREATIGLIPGTGFRGPPDAQSCLEKRGQRFPPRVLALAPRRNPKSVAFH